MSNDTSRISINVDVTNPGQFFACCGLLELAHRLWPGAEGWFEGNDDRFVIHHPSGNVILDLKMILESVCCSIFVNDIMNLRKTPFSFSEPLDLCIDWHTHDNFLKTWAGQQETPTIAISLQSGLKSIKNESLDCLFDIQVPIFNNEYKSISAFYFDSRRFTTSLDLGFDTDEATIAEYLIVELFALIGLQRFSPSPVKNERRCFQYAIWNKPLPAIVAQSVASAVVAITASKKYQFNLLCRDEGCHLKAFSYAIERKDKNHE